MSKEAYEEVIADVLKIAREAFIPNANEEFLKGYREAVEDIAEDFSIQLAEFTDR